MNKDSKKLENLYNSLAEESLEMSESELEDELTTVFNSSIDKESEKLKQVFSLSLKAFQDGNKEKASQTANTKEPFSLGEILKEQLPKKLEYIKELIQDCKKYGIPEPTLQFRNLDSLSEEDADLIIKVLLESGIVEKIKKAKNELS